MIDTDKYEGHTPAPWEYNTDDDGWTLAAIRERDDPDRDDFVVLMTKPEGNPHLTMNPDLKLIADAPLLLAEVERLRNILRTVSIDIRPQDMGDSVEWYQKLREEYGGKVVVE